MNRTPNSAETNRDPGSGTEGGGDAPGTHRPEILHGLGPDDVVDLDVREQLRSGGEPFQRIMTAASGLAPDAVLRVRAIFEPVPLYAVMASRGFEHWTEQLDAEDWRVWFYRPEMPA